MRESRYLIGSIGIVVVLLVASCGEYAPVEGDVPLLDVFPDSVQIEVSCSHDFDAGFEGSPHVVAWYVNGIEGGDPGRGMITKAGTYVAPAAVPDDGFVTIRARSLEEPDLEGTGTVLITPSPSEAFVVVEPETATVLVAGSSQFSGTVSGCGSDSVIWSLDLVWGVATGGLGNIDEAGGYEAPATSGDNFDILVRATGAGCLNKSGIAKVRIPAEPRTFTVELEGFETKFDVPGSAKIMAEDCSMASSGHAVVGLDRAGEYIEVPMSVRGAGRYLAYLGYAADPDTRTWVRVEARGCGNAQNSASFTLDQGEGTT
jgi:hypothetical protein